MELVGSIEAAGAAARLLAEFRKSSWPVFHIQYISVQPSATFIGSAEYSVGNRF